MSEANKKNSLTLSNLSGAAKTVGKSSDIFFAIGVIGILMVLLVPVPTWLLDFLLSISFTISVIILMTVLFIGKPLDLSSFPTILLISTMLRLSLNIGSTRLILSEGHNGTAAAGHVIEAFGNFVMQGSLVIGLIVFFILTVINFVVITKGAGRIAEVSARFSLDSMPGKQMAIDADLSAGLIDETTAKARRKELEDESGFFGSMDGASKFVRGDAIAGLIITFINLIGGILIGVVQKDMEFSDAMQTYSLLTIGDGLVSQIPALLVSTAAGLLVTKSGDLGSADKAVLGQLGGYPKALGISGALLVIMAFLPGMPALPFITLAIVCGGTAWLMYQAQKKQGVDASGRPLTASALATAAGMGQGAGQQTGAAGGAADAKQAEEPISESLHIDSVRLELGYGLLPLINYQKGHRLTEQIKALRKQMAKEMGFIMPPVRIQDNMQLPPNIYVIKVKDIECGRGDIRPDMLLIMDPRGDKIMLPGEDTKEPAFGLPAMWVAENYREEALFKNYTVVDPPTVITTHLTEIIKENMPELLSYSETQKLLDEMGKDHQKLVADTIPSVIAVSSVQRVLQNLLAEGISVRDMPSILEAIAEAARVTQNLTTISEHVRTRLSRQISNMNTTADGYIPIVTLSPKWEQSFSEAMVGSGEDRQLALAPTKIHDFISSIRQNFDQFAMKGEVPVLLTSPNIRPYVRSIIERFRPSIVVLSQNEIHPKAKIKTLGTVS